MANKHRKFMEDDFDLDLYIKEQTDKTFLTKIREKSRKLSGVVKIMLIIVSFITAYTIYSYASYWIEVWRANRINETARDIAEEVPVSEYPADAFIAAPRAISQNSVTPAPAFMPAIVGLRDSFQNDDIVAYLKIADSNIDFPVVLADDNAYYLTRDLRKQDNAAGSGFMDYENRLKPLSFNTVIYAHNMRDGSMFHNLRNYADEEYFNEHRTISLQTLYEDTMWEIFSFYETSTDFLYNTTEFSDAYEFLEFLEFTKSKSQYPSDITFTEETRILTLSTCTNRAADDRYVVHAYRTN
ncbi:MAG: class B sortase [Clostridiales bacterium]|jgi:SrtB family sortase|nr:class B sortase [Clostridiales bacterium]